MQTVKQREKILKSDMFDSWREEMVSRKAMEREEAELEEKAALNPKPLNPSRRRAAKGKGEAKGQAKPRRHIARTRSCPRGPVNKRNGLGI